MRKDTPVVDDPIVQVRNSSITYEMDRGRSTVLDDASLDIQRQEILGVVGESGSGKSMFANALLDAVPPPGMIDGTITYHPAEGSSIDILSLGPEELRRFRWDDISMVFQGAQSSFNPTRKVRTHFVETLEAHNRAIGPGMEHARGLLRDVYLDPERVLDSYPHELSGGMKQRALIALSLLLDPSVLVMDEPTAALDLLMQRSIISLIDDLQTKYDLTVVFITHDLPLVANLADRIAVMYAFDFVELGPAKSVIENPTHPYTRALIRTIPEIGTPLSQMRPVEGASPDPVNPIEGCSYHPRCPLADDECRQAPPDYVPVESDHVAACFHWEESAEAVRLDRSKRPERVHESAGRPDSGSNRPVVSLQDVSVHFEQEETGILESLFGDPAMVKAVDDVDLDIFQNDVVALVGESGCGKTTLGKTAIGLQRPTKGAVQYQGNDIWEATGSDGSMSFETVRDALQIIHQDPGSSLNPNRTVRGILDAPQKFSGRDLSSQDRYENTLNMLNRVGMTPAEDYAGRYPFQLSGGEKQRVALVRALLKNPDLILADEAVSALDVSLRVEMMDLMLELQDVFDTSYLFISHNLANARYFAGNADGRIGIMYLGRIVEIGPVDDIISNPKHPYTKALLWSTTDLDLDAPLEDPPIRSIDIPDPVDPPSGCRFHTRCPFAREECVETVPGLDSRASDHHEAACFRDFPEDHPYWTSNPLEGTDDVADLQL